MDHQQLTPQLQALLQSPEVGQLVRLLSAKDQAAVQRAAQAAQQGDEAAVRQSLTPMLQDPAVAALLQRLAAQGGR